MSELKKWVKAVLFTLYPMVMAGCYVAWLTYNIDVLLFIAIGMLFIAGVIAFKSSF